MKKGLIKSVIIAASLAVAMTASAKATPIKFAKGSYCGSWSGEFYGDTKTFSLGLGAGQDVSISVADGSVLSKFSGPTGELRSYGGDYSSSYFKTKKAGMHYVTVVYIPHKYADYQGPKSSASVEVCAY
ncbi:hypothetical protein ACFBZI_06960 [Moraxella sp. ZJ142]|uniref:hypothetical protein n=1 Tax=Moraxella marmotae TaxID=3344520 RepID=UPI0035D408D8